MREQLANTFSGRELEKLTIGTARTRAALLNTHPNFRNLLDDTWSAIERVVEHHFRPFREGVFGGQITAGEGWFIGAWMAAIRPSSMIEIGVASGYASALIVSFAEEFGLLKDGTPFLHSIDIAENHGASNIIGSVMRRDFGHLLPYWSLQTSVTTATAPHSDLLGERLAPGPALAVLDADHRHPWPVIDLAFIKRRLPVCEWAIVNNAALTERWLHDAIIYDAPVPYPSRGMQFAASHWPGSKLIGADACFNVAALNTTFGDEALDEFCQAMGRYPPEAPDEQREANDAILAELGCRPAPT